MVALGLLLFLAITSLVVWRRSLGLADAKALRALELERRTLLTERTTLEKEIREAMSGPRVVRDAQRRLGLTVASELQLRTLIIDPDGSSGPVRRP